MSLSLRKKRTTPTQDAPPGRPQQRIRFNITRSTYDLGDHYGNTYDSEHVDVDPAGGALSSLLPNGQHAPVLDVDHQVSFVYTGERTVLRFSGRFFRVSKLHDVLPSLVKAGMLESHFTYTELTRVSARRGWGLLGLTRSITISFPYRVVVLPSKTAGHSHLLCQTQMPWSVAKLLAADLGYTGIVDSRHAAISGKGNFLYVNQPPSEHDTVG